VNPNENEWFAVAGLGVAPSLWDYAICFSDYSECRTISSSQILIREPSV